MANLTNFKQMTIQLKAGTLADAYVIDHYTADAIGTSYSGLLYGWPWGCTVRSRSKNRASGLIQLQGDYGISPLLKKYITFSAAATLASSIMAKAAAQLGCTLSLSIDDHGCRQMSEQTTVMQVLSSLFGWRSAVPQEFVNVFLRGGVLHVVQRGKESGVYALQKYNLISEADEVMDTLMDECLWAPKLIGDPDGSYTEGTVSFGSGTSVTYAGGYVVKIVEGGRTTTLAYSDDDPNDPDSDDKYLLSKTVTEAGQPTITTVYSYESWRNVLYLAQEVSESRIDYSSLGLDRDFLVDRTATMYAPLHEGFFSSVSRKYSRTVSGSLQGGVFAGTITESGPTLVSSQIIEGRPGGKSTPRQRSGDENTPVIDISRNPVVSNHIPVTDSAALERYRDALLWLDGKTQYSLSVDCYDAHVVDFDQRVSVAGNEWFLEANQISISAGGIKQSLELVRWA